MLIVECKGPFEDYIASLSKKARQQYKYVQKHNADLTYKEVPYQEELVASYMDLWSKQKIRGESIEWAFPVGTVTDWMQRGALLLFECELGMQFIQRRKGYWDCHPPMYEKTINKERYLGKYMWFELLRYAHKREIILNLGGGPDNWREHIKRRNEFPNPKYKWIYVPEAIKNNPDLAPDYTIYEHTLL